MIVSNVNTLVLCWEPLLAVALMVTRRFVIKSDGTDAGVLRRFHLSFPTEKAGNGSAHLVNNVSSNQRGKKMMKKKEHGR